LPGIRSDPAFETLHDHPGYVALVEKM